MKLRSLFIIVVASVGIFAQANPLAAPGRFKAGWRSVTVSRPNNSTFTARLYYPAANTGQNTAFDPSGGPYPAITFGHGFLQAVSNYQSTLEHLATHGYFVIATDSESGLFPNHQNFANDLRSSLTFLELENSNSSSVFFNQVRTSSFGASGHSMGGGASILASAQDPRIKALANLAAAETSPSAVNAMVNVSIPASLIAASADSIVPLSTNGQLMFNAGPAPKVLPVIQGGWHCGFIDANGFGCDSGSITRTEQLAETRRLLTSFFNLYLKSDESNWKQVWGTDVNGALVQAQVRSGIEMALPVEIPNTPVGVLTTIPILITNRGPAPSSYRVFIEQRRWLGTANPAQTPTIGPNESTIVEINVRRLWKNPRLLNTILVSARSNNDHLTRGFAILPLQ